MKRDYKKIHKYANFILLETLVREKQKCPLCSLYFYNLQTHLEDKFSKKGVKVVVDNINVKERYFIYKRINVRSLKIVLSKKTGIQAKNLKIVWNNVELQNNQQIDNKVVLLRQRVF